MHVPNTSKYTLSVLSLAGLLLLVGAGCGTPKKSEPKDVVISLPTSTGPVVTVESEDHGATNTTSTAAIPENVDTPAGTEDVKFLLGGKNFAFLMDGKENPELRVKQGQKVRIEFTSESGFHDWVVDEFKAATKQVQTGGKTSVEFVADKKGTFEYYCSVGKHRQNGMKGNLIVE